MSASPGADAEDGEQDIELTQTQPTRGGYDEEEERGPLESQDPLVDEYGTKQERDEENELEPKQEVGSDQEGEPKQEVASDQEEEGSSLTQGEMQAAEVVAQEIEREAAEEEGKQQAEEEESNQRGTEGEEVLEASVEGEVEVVEGVEQEAVIVESEGQADVEITEVVEEGVENVEEVVIEEGGTKMEDEEEVKPEEELTKEEEVAKEEQEEGGEVVAAEEEENEERGPGGTQLSQEGEEEGEGPTQQSYLNALFGSDSEGEGATNDVPTETHGEQADALPAEHETNVTQSLPEEDMKALFGSDSEGGEQQDRTQRETGGEGETGETGAEEKSQEASYRDLFGSDSDAEMPQDTFVSDISRPSNKKKKAVASGPPTTIYTAEVPPGLQDCDPIVRFNLSNVLAIEPKKYDPETFELEEHTRSVLGRTNKIIKKVRLATENVIRWRTVIDENGNEKRESNARLVEWEDGSKHLYLGGEIFRVEEEAIDPRVNLLFVATPLKTPGVPLHQCFGGFSRLMKFEPTKGVDSKSHAKLTNYIKQSHLKLPKIKRTTTVGMSDREIERMQMEFDKQQRAKDRLAEARRGKRREEDEEGITAEFLTSGVQDDDEDEDAQAFSDDEASQRLVNAKSGVVSDQEATEDEDQVQKVKRRRARESESAEEETRDDDVEEDVSVATKRKRKKQG